MNKQELREAYLSKRQALSAEEVKEKSGLIAALAIEKIQQTEAETVHLFLPIQQKQEVDTWLIYRFLIDSNRHTPVISKTHWQARQLSHHPMTVNDGHVVSKMGVPEPTHSREFPAEEIDLILVPLLTFDSHGHRLGYGAGLYDRFLADCHPQALKIGLSLLPAHQQNLPSEPFDIALDACITPEGFIDFKA